MTTQESFKRRIRARMAKTGERYGAARRALIGQQQPAGWVSDPGVDEDRLRAATGRGWAQWCRVIDDWPGHREGHTAVAAHLVQEQGVDPWWAQGVTVGWERIRGHRLLHQRPDGTFSAGVSRTVRTDPLALREMLLDDGEREQLFPGHDTELRSRPAARSLRVSFGEGVALFSLDARPDGRVKVTVTHEKLAAPADVPVWKDYWAGWLEALDDPQG